MKKIAFPIMGDYYVPANYLFSNICKCEIIRTPKITNKTVELGSKNSPDFICTPFKYTLASFIECLEKGADTLIQMGGGCRYGYYYELQEKILSDLGYNFKLYNIEVINIEKINLEELSNYEPKYKDIKIIVSSLRMDNIISKITNDSRKFILERFKNKEIIKNYQVITKYTTNLQVGDIFSIRKYGKYRFDRIEKITKSGGYIINIRKYL